MSPTCRAPATPRARRGLPATPPPRFAGSLPTAASTSPAHCRRWAPISTSSRSRPVVGTVDVHVYDIARVEALAGPQGTLYGASSEAGTIRIISNKPDPSKASGSYDLELNKISKGGFGGQAEGYFNLPIVKDRVALRTVAWYEHTGGYIDNVLRSRRFPTSGIVQTNSAMLKDNANDVDIYGLRAQLGIDLNDSWTVTPSVNYQKTRWNGSFMSDDTKVGELKTAHYFPEYGRDEFVQAGGTITGKLADLDVTYAGYYMDRRRADQNDYADYGYFYDLVAGSGSGVVNNAGQMIDPSQVNRNRAHLTKHSQELRVATPTHNRIRAVAGLFFQRQTQRDENDYLTPGFADRLSIPGRPGQVWLTLENRVDRDYAAFGQSDSSALTRPTLEQGCVSASAARRAAGRMASESLSSQGRRAPTLVLSMPTGPFRQNSRRARASPGAPMPPTS